MKDNAKQNLAPRPSECDWYVYENVPLNNGNEEYPDGDEIGVLVRWYPQEPLVGFSWPQIKAVLDKIDRGIDPQDGNEDHREYYTSSSNSKDRYAVPLIAGMLHVNRERAKLMLKDWLKTRVLNESEKYLSKGRSNQNAKKLTVRREGVIALMDRMAARA